MSLIAEAFVFSYIGLTFFSYGTYAWSTDLIIVEIFIVIFGRAFGTIVFYSLLNLCGYEKKNPLSWKELIFIWYAGMIRGAIAFGLVLRIEPQYSVNREVIVTTCLSLVVCTTVVFGSTVGYIGNAFFGEE
jgi:sodium/hydrogen exchanger-like protein 6/7/sodium/hydrogen exchanger 8